ncbi:DNA polymerase Y family protein [Roseomonas sp. CCTCC AB2023176]|uniref:Y-family DNA polymerase n=1 Tax=Roseomonas sp. CCTCC AB2023176 TaxID=3342640 RepID=UPI0035E1A49C
MPAIREAPPGPAPSLHEAGRRFLALHLPFLATETLRHAGPVLTWMTDGNRRLVVAADAAALRLGLRPGMPLGDANALAPGVACIPDDPARTANRLESLALSALRLSPLVAMEPPDSLLLEITGGAHLFGGEDALLRRAVAGLARLGHAAVGVVAGTARAAAALARHGTAGVLSVQEEVSAVAALPVAALPVDPAVLAGLRRLGLHQVGDVLRQPRAPLVRRFGQPIAFALDALTGAIETPFRSIRPAPEWRVAREFLEPIITRTAIDHAVARLLADLCARLAEGGRGLRRLTLRAHRADGGVQEIAIGTGLASRDPRHLSRLLESRLEQLAPGFGFDRMALLADEVEPLAAAQARLLADAEDARGALAALVDRLMQRLPVHRLRPRATHWPERGVERVGPLDDVAPPREWVEGWVARPRPLRLLRRPERLQAVSLLPDAAPSRLQHRGRWIPVRAAEGPERLEPEWWRDRPDRPLRDYYRVELEDGRRWWVCRAGGPGSPDWYLHGLFA